MGECDGCGKNPGVNLVGLQTSIRFELLGFSVPQERG